MKSIPRLREQHMLLDSDVASNFINGSDTAFTKMITFQDVPANIAHVMVVTFKNTKSIDLLYYMGKWFQIG